MATLLRRISAACLVLILGLLAGCIHVPVPMPEGEAIYGRHVFDEADLAFFQTGEVTRADVLFRFGEPDLSSTDERVIGYVWENFAGVYIVLMFPYIPVAGGTWPRTHLVLMEFDGDGRLKRWDSEEFSYWSSTIGQHVEEWIPDWEEGYLQTGHPKFISLWPLEAAPVARRRAPLRVKVEPVADRHSPDGTSCLILGRQMGWGYDVLSRQPVADVLTAALQRQLRAAGHEVVDENEDIVIRATIDYFQFSQGQLKVGFWDPARTTTFAAADVRMEISDSRHPEAVRELSLSGREQREAVFPQPQPYEDMAKACIAQMLAQFAAEFDQIETGQDSNQ
ncbi:MAG TPA: hypothetical protein VK995_06570 [Oceanipulchritudo sp.]|nr:hypothetical protein [Oceanipulchritudo sp.]